MSQREAFELKGSLELNNSDGSMAMQNANVQVELAWAKFREALRDFVSVLERGSEQSSLSLRERRVSGALQSRE